MANTPGLEQVVLMGIHQLDPVPALHFGRVEGLVRELDGPAGIALYCRHDRGNTDADGHSGERPRSAVLDVQLADGRADSLGDLPGLVAVDVIQERRELLATIACQQIQRPAHRFLNRPCNLAQGVVAGLVPVEVVVGFEVVDVENQDRQRAPVPDSQLPQMLEVLIEHPAILRPRQRIALGELGDELAFEKRLSRDPLEMPDGNETGRNAAEQENVRNEGRQWV